MQSAGQISDWFHDQLMDKLQAKDQEHSYSLALLKQENSKLHDRMTELVARRLGYAQHTELQQAFIKGTISDEVYEHMVEEIDGDIDGGIIGVVDEPSENVEPGEEEEKAKETEEASE